MTDKDLKERCQKGYCQCYASYCKFCIEENQQQTEADIEEERLPF